jgi:hypothetical protein
MSELGTDYIGSKELVFNNDTNLGIHSGGFSVNSIMMKGGMSPIMTINSEQLGGTKEKVSDLFNDLVIPNWALSYNNKLVGGKYNEIEKKINDNYDSDDDIIDDDLHEKLLDLVKQHESKIQKTKSNKKTTRRIRNKNAGTKKRK